MGSGHGAPALQAAARAASAPSATCAVAVSQVMCIPKHYVKPMPSPRQLSPAYPADMAGWGELYMGAGRAMLGGPTCALAWGCCWALQYSPKRAQHATLGRRNALSTPACAAAHPCRHSRSPSSPVLPSRAGLNTARLCRPRPIRPKHHRCAAAHAAGGQGSCMPT